MQRVILNQNGTATLTNSRVEVFGAGSVAVESFNSFGSTNTITATNTLFSAASGTLLNPSLGDSIFNFTNVSANASLNQLLLNVGASGLATLTFTANTSEFSGDMQVVAGSNASVTLGNSVWRGAALNLSNLTLNDSLWNLTADSLISIQLINGDLIDFVPNGNTFKDLTVIGSYIGTIRWIGLILF